MRRRLTTHLASTILVLLLAACGSDSTGPGDYGDPPVSPPTDSSLDALWTAGGIPGALLGLVPAQLRQSGAVDAALAITSPDGRLGTLSSLAFQEDGTLWVAAMADSTLVGFSPASLRRSGERAPDRVVTAVGHSIASPRAIAFDREHNLWVANAATRALVRFDAPQLAAGGPQLPTVVIDGVGFVTGMAFDADGALWVSTRPARQLVKFTAAMLEASGSPTPEIVVTAADSSLDHAAGVAFDRSGGLWVANTDRNVVVVFTAGQLSRGGRVLPAVTISRPPGNPAIPTGIAFGADGALWVIGVEGDLVRFDCTVLGRSGTPSPSVAITLTGQSLFWNLAFWPRPAGPPAG